MAALSKLLKYLMKLHDDASQIKSDPEVIPYPSIVTYENQLSSRLFSSVLIR